MHIDARNASEAEHDGLRGQEAPRLQVERLGSMGIRERIKVGDVQFVDGLAAIGLGLVGDVATMRQCALDHGLHLRVAENPLGRPYPDTIVRRHKIEEGGAAGGRIQAAGPFRKTGGIAGMEGVQDQRGERELVDHLGLVRAIAKVGDVLLVGDVGLGDEDHMRGDRVQYGPEELDHAVCLLKVDTGSADLFPQIRDGVQADDLGALFDVEEENLDDSQQHVGIGIVEINLIRAKGRPHQPLAAMP